MRLLRTDPVRLFRVALLAFVLVAMLALMLPTSADPDLWGHVRYGMDMLDARAIVRTDIYSYLTEPGFWYNHQWLAQVLMGAAYRATGSRGLLLLKLVMTSAIAGVLYSTLRRRGARPVVACGALLLTMASMSFVYAPVRPQLFTTLGFVVLLRLVTEFEMRPRAIWGIVPLLLVWTNAHGGILAGVGFLGIWYAIQALMRVHAVDSLRPLATREFATLTAAVALALVATLLNPYGPALWRFLLETATVARPEISDWQPLAVYRPLLGMFFLWILLGGWALYRSARPRSVPMLAIWVVAAMLSLTAVRHLLFFLAAWPVALAEHLDAAWEYMLPKRLRAGRAHAPAAALLAAATLALLVRVAQDPWDVVIGPMQYPLRAVALLRENVTGADMVTPFNWGQFMLWHLGPDNRVSMDGRRETVYSEAIYQMNMDFLYGHDDWDRLLEERSPDLVVTQKEFPSHNLMLLRPGWALVYEDPLGGIFAPVDSPLREKLEQAPRPDLSYDGDGMVFPADLGGR